MALTADSNKPMRSALSTKRVNHPNYIRWMVQTMKFLFVEPSPLIALVEEKERDHQADYRHV